MTDQEAIEIAEAIMDAQEITAGEGMVSIHPIRLRAMLMAASKMGAEKGRPF